MPNESVLSPLLVITQRVAQLTLPIAFEGFIDKTPQQLREF